MAKSRNANLQIDVEFIEKVENERTGKVYEKSRWVPYAIGSIVGLSIADGAPIHDLGRGWPSVHTAFASLDARRNLGGPKLKWSNSKQPGLLSGIPRI